MLSKSFAVIRSQYSGSFEGGSGGVIGAMARRRGIEMMGAAHEGEQRAGAGERRDRRTAVPTDSCIKKRQAYSCPYGLVHQHV